MDGACKLESVYAAGSIVGDDRSSCIVNADAPGMRCRANSPHDIADLCFARCSLSFDRAVDTENLDDARLLATGNMASGAANDNGSRVTSRFALCGDIVYLCSPRQRLRFGRSV